jgi:NADP-dependent 3-hydroxy acid dehydrogenase YdfG
VTDTPFFDNSPGETALRDTDIAKAVVFALEQGPGVDVNEILIRPTVQPE